MAVLCGEKKDTEREKEYAKQALALARKHNLYKIIGASCSVLSSSEALDGNHELSFQYLEEGLNAFEKINFPVGLIMIKANIGNYYTEKKAFRKARSYYSEVLEISEKIKFSQGLIIGYSNFGELYFKWGRYKLARQYFEKSLPLAIQMQDVKREKVHYEFLAKIAKEQKDYKSALQYTDQYQVLEDSLQVTAKVKQIEELQL